MRLSEDKIQLKNLIRIRTFVFGLLFSSITLLSSCSKDQSYTEADSGDTKERYVLVSGSLNSVKPASEVADILRQFDEIQAPDFLDIDLSEFGLELRTYRIVYRTKDNRGQEIQLSGDVSFLANPIHPRKRILESVSLFHSAFFTDEGKSTEYEQYAFPGRSIHNALVVYPHYQGVHEGRKPEYVEGHPVTIAELLLKARQGIDCELAAIELINKLEGVELMPEYYTENIGLSCGAGTALATQYLLENDPQLKSVNKESIRLVGTYCCEGCYSYSGLLSKLMEVVPYDESLSEFTSMEDFKPACLIAVIVGAYDTWKGMKDSDGNEFFAGVDDVREYFSQEFLNSENLFEDDGRQITDIIGYFRTGTLSAHSRIFKRAGFLSSTMINPELINSDHEIDVTNPKMKALLEALAQNDRITADWNPSARICISHSTDDEFVPYSQALGVYKSLSRDGANRNVVIQTICGLNHTDGNRFYAIKDIILKKHPCFVLGW